MEIGVSTACYYPLETELVPQRLKACNVRYAEIFLNSFAEYNAEYCKKLRETLDACGIQAVSVHSFVAMHEPFLFSSYARRTQDALAVYRSVIEAASILGASYHTFHGARKEMLSEGLDYQDFGKRLTELSEIAGAHGVQLAMENVSWCVGASPAFWKNCLPYIQSAHFGFTLDLKQAFRAGVDYKTYLKLFKNRLLNVHISDKNCNKDCMLPGQGNTNFEEVVQALRAVGYNGKLMIEVYRNAFATDEEMQQAVCFMENTVRNCTGEMREVK